MIMPDQEHDWLDERLAEMPYLPDGGFTERVVSHLPQSIRTDAGRVRRRILTIATGSALALGLVLAVRDVPSLVHTMTPLANAAPFTHAAGYLVEWARQPMFFYGGAAAITLSSFAILPFLRRWV